MKRSKYQYIQIRIMWLNIILSIIFFSFSETVFCYNISSDKKACSIDSLEDEIVMPQLIFTGGNNLQHVIDSAPNHSTIICNSNRQLTVAVPITISKPLMLKGLNAKLPDNLGKTSIIEVKSEGVTITDFVLRGNATTVSQKERAALITIYTGGFCIKRGLIENSSKDGIEVDRREFPTLVDGGVIRDVVGRGCVRDVISLGVPAGPEPHVKNILLENIRGYDSSLRGPVEISDGCQNVTVRKIYAENCSYAIDIQDHNKQEINHNILINDVYALRCTRAIRTANHPNGHSKLTLVNITAEHCEKALYIHNTNNVNIQNIRILGYNGEEPAMSLANCNDITVRDVSLIDCASRKAGIFVENCVDMTIDGVRLRNSENLSGGVVYRLSEDRNFGNLIITNVCAKNVNNTGIVLEKKDIGATLSGYIISNNIAMIIDGIKDLNGLVINNIN